MTTARWARKGLTTTVVAIACPLAVSVASAGQSYDLSRTAGTNCFVGSAEAERVLPAQGFVVAAPS